MKSNYRYYKSKNYLKRIKNFNTISIFVSLRHEILNLLLGEHRPQHLGHLLQLLHVNVAISVAVKYLREFFKNIEVK